MPDRDAPKSTPRWGRAYLVVAVVGFVSLFVIGSATAGCVGTFNCSENASRLVRVGMVLVVTSAVMAILWAKIREKPTYVYFALVGYLVAGAVGTSGTGSQAVQARAESSAETATETTRVVVVGQLGIMDCPQNRSQTSIGDVDASGSTTSDKALSLLAAEMGRPPGVPRVETETGLKVTYVFMSSEGFRLGRVTVAREKSGEWFITMTERCG